MKYIGNYENNLDSKGRMIVPSKFRKNLGSIVIVSLEFEGTLVIRHLNDFKIWASKINSQDTLSKSARTLQRMILGRSEEVSVDAKGRINIPATLLKDSKIKGQVQVVGVGDKIEIFNIKSWKDMNTNNSMSLEDAADELSKES